MKKIVIDTNITIAAIFWNGNPRKIYDLAKNNKVKLFYSQAILEELIRVLAYKNFGLSTHEMLPIINDFLNTANPVKTSSRVKIISKDPTDNIFLECAIDSASQYIVSGDHHLLELKNYQGIEIITPQEFIADKLYQEI